MIAYVDEWGVPKPGAGGTSWFGFGMVMVPEHRVPDLQRWLNKACDSLRQTPFSSVHMRSLRGDNKYYLVKSLASEGFAVSVMAVKTDKIRSSNLHKKGWSYRFFGREMVRVATQYGATIAEQATVVFESHGYLDDFERYIQVMLKNNSFYLKKQPTSRIDYDHLAGIQVKLKSEEPLLSSADCVSHSAHLAFNGSELWNMNNPTYLDALADCMWEGIAPFVPGRGHGALLKPWDIGDAELIDNLPAAFKKFWGNSETKS